MSKRAHEHSKVTARQSHMPSRIQSQKQKSNIDKRKKEEVIFKNNEIEKAEELVRKRKTMAKSPDAP